MFMVAPAGMSGLLARLSRQANLPGGSVVVMVLHVDVISDVICPWCFIGKRRLEKAIAAVEGQHEVRVRWLPFQLNPTMPKEGISRREYRTRSSEAGSGRWNSTPRWSRSGEAEGIHFAFDRIERTPNTLDAHRLIWLADKEGVQDAVVEALFRAYFTEGRDISNRQTLIDVVAEAGLDRHQAEAVLKAMTGWRRSRKRVSRPGVFGWRACRSSSSTARSRWPVPSSPMRFLRRSAMSSLESRSLKTTASHGHKKQVRRTLEGAAY